MSASRWGSLTGRDVLGDAILFATHDRLVRIGGVYGLQPVKHGMAPITMGGRVVLGLPFHEYR